MTSKEHLCTIVIVLLTAQSTMLVVNVLTILASGQVQTGYSLGFGGALLASEWIARRLRPTWR